MAVDVYFKEDILNVLRATHAASEGSAVLVLDMLKDPDFEGAPVEKLLRAYQRGFNTALGATALGFGLNVLGPRASFETLRSEETQQKSVHFSQLLALAEQKGEEG